MELPMCPSFLRRQESRKVYDSGSPRRRTQLLILNGYKYATGLSFFSSCGSEVLQIPREPIRSVGVF
jgi:hypothetical protein